MLNIIRPKKVTEQDRKEAKAKAESLDDKLKAIERQRGISLDFESYIMSRDKGRNAEPGIEQIYNELFNKCTLLHMPFDQEPDRPGAILYIISNERRSMGRIAMDFEEEELPDGYWSEMPKDVAYSPDCAEIFRNIAEPSGFNLYIVENPSTMIAPDMLAMETLRQLCLAYEESKKRKGFPDEVSEDRAGMQLVGFSTTEEPSEKAIERVMEEHPSLAYMKAKGDN